MASGKIAEAYVEITAHLDKMNADLVKAKKDFASASGQMQKQADGLSGSIDMIKASYALAAGVIGGAFVAAIAGAIKSTADHLDQLDEMSAKTGVSVEMLSSLELAAKQNSVSMDQLATSIRMMYRSIDAAAQGTKESVDAYKRLGVNVLDASGKIKSGNEAFIEVAGAIAKIQNPAERSALAMKVFGRAGAEMLPMLEKGADGLREYIAQAQRLGLVFTDADAKKGAAFNDVLDAMNKKLETMYQKIALKVMPALTEMISKVLGEEVPEPVVIIRIEEELDKLTDKISESQAKVLSLEKDIAEGVFNAPSVQKEIDKLNASMQANLKLYDTYAASLAVIKMGSGAVPSGSSGGGAGDGGASSRFGGMKAAIGLPSRNIGDEAKAINEAALGMRGMTSSTAELIGMFPELQATIIDTSVTLGDKLVAPFENMMNDLQGAWANTISEFLKGGQSFGDFMESIFSNVLNSFVNMIGQMAAQQLAASIFSSVTGLKYNSGGVGASLASAQMGTTININAVDAQSFAAAVRRNPAAITEVVWEAQRFGRAM